MTTEQKHTITIPKCETEQQSWSCKNMKESGNDFDYERYKCEVCGRSMKLDYEEMR